MANDLGVNSEGLQAAASSSDGLATELALSGVDGSAIGSQPSHRGASAILAAIESVSRRQSRRVSFQAGRVALGASQYESADIGSAADITNTV
jgi:hypothetical protein